MNDLYADRLGNVVIANGVVRLDFLRLRAVAGADKLEMEAGVRLAMPLAELPRTIAMLESMRDQLLKQQVPAPETAAVSMAPG